MSKGWQKKQLDLDILNLIYEFKALRGKTIVALIKEENTQKVYDRLFAMKKAKRIKSDPYSEKDMDAESNKRTRGLQTGKMFYMTQKGLADYTLAVTGKEMADDIIIKPPSEDVLIKCYYNSLLMENINLPFTSRKSFLGNSNLYKNYSMDIGCNGWQLIHAHPFTENYGKLLINQSKRAESDKINHRILLCRNNRHMLQLMRFHMQNISPETYFMLNTDYEVIKTFLSANAEELMHQSLGERNTIELPSTPQGCKYIINGEPSNIYPLIGNPARLLRRLQSVKSDSVQGILGFATPEQEELYNTYFAEQIKGYSTMQIDEGIIREPKTVDEEPASEKSHEEVYSDWADINTQILN